MSVWTTSLQSTSEVLSSILSKYKIESEVGHFYFTFKTLNLLEAERKRIFLNLSSKTLKSFWELNGGRHEWYIYFERVTEQLCPTWKSLEISDHKIFLQFVLLVVYTYIDCKYNNLKQTILGDKFWVVCCERNRWN